MVLSVSKPWISITLFIFSNSKDRMGDKARSASIQKLKSYNGLYFLDQISIMADSNPIFIISVYAIMLERSVVQTP